MPRRSPTLSPRRLSALVSRAPVPGPKTGYTPIVSPSPRADPGGMGMAFGLLRLARGKPHRETPSLETALVLLSGSVAVTFDGRHVAATRASLFDEGPTTFHFGAGTPFEIVATRSRAELAVVRAANPRPLPPRVTTPAEIATEDRGAGLAQGACRRLVRTIFDYSTRPDSALVLGEVVNYPGRWSSYPGHHHAQPEIYHYRFTLPQGYGHAELGEAVVKVRNGDTVSIPGGLDHAQVSAPGYGMYYLWIVRHLPRRPYTGFTFSAEHTWLLDPQHQGWQPTPPSL